MDDISKEAFESLKTLEKELKKVEIFIKQLQEISLSLLATAEEEVGKGGGNGRQFRDSMESTALIGPAARISSAEVHTLICFTIDTLAFINLKLNGIPTKSHAVKKELSRCEGYFEKIESIKARLKGPRMAVDQKASKRFIAAGLGLQRETSLSSSPSATHQRFDVNGNLTTSSAAASPQ